MTYKWMEWSIKLKHYYKIPWGSLKEKLSFLIFDLVRSIKHQATLPPVNTQLNTYSVETMMVVGTSVIRRSYPSAPCEPGGAWRGGSCTRGSKVPTHAVTKERQEDNGASLGITTKPMIQ